MVATMGRRAWIAGAAAGVAAVGFDPVARTWVSEAAAAPRHIALPNLDGELVLDATALAEAADDFGHIIHRYPIAVLRPGSVDDIVELVCFANRHGIHVAARGQGHSTFGQAQVEGGVVIDTRSLATIHEIGSGEAWVDAGVVWSELLARALETGQTPPVLTDYLELSVGGTLSVGGIGGATQRYGFQVDNVQELEVVTGEGQRVTCSPTRYAGLFNTVLAGLGQVAIITRARVRLIAAPTSARVYQLYYGDLAAFTAAQRRALADGRFDYLEGQIVPAASGGWAFMLEAAKYFDATPPDDAALLAGLDPDDPSANVVFDTSYFEWQNRLAPLVAFLRSSGAWDLPHPWLNLFVPGSQVDRFLGEVLSNLTLDDTGQGPVLLYPFDTRRARRPLLQLPNEPVAFLFSILRFAPPVPGLLEHMIAQNRSLFERARALGGMRYPIGSVPMTQQDWLLHYGAEWFLLALQKARFDSRNVLTPGQGIFSPV